MDLGNDGAYYPSQSQLPQSQRGSAFPLPLGEVPPAAAERGAVAFFFC